MRQLRSRLCGFRLETHRGGASRSGRHKRNHQNNGPRFRPGDPVRETGIYEVVHDRQHRETHEAVMLGGDRFPACDTCNERVRFRLVRTAPYIFTDEDFEKD